MALDKDDVPFLMRYIKGGGICIGDKNGCVDCIIEKYIPSSQYDLACGIPEDKRSCVRMIRSIIESNQDVVFEALL